jgi:hypothetical protein
LTTLLFIITGFLIVNSSLHGPVIFGQQQEKNQHYSFVSKWDSEGSGDGQLSRPHSIDIDSNSGHVYVADSGNIYILKHNSFSQDPAFIPMNHIHRKTEKNWFTTLES